MFCILTLTLCVSALMSLSNIHWGVSGRFILLLWGVNWLYKQLTITYILHYHSTTKAQAFVDTHTCRSTHMHAHTPVDKLMHFNPCRSKQILWAAQGTELEASIYLYMHMHMCTCMYADVICANTHMQAHISTHMHTLAMQNIHTQIHNVLNVRVCYRDKDVPSVSYDHREFIDGELVLLPELKPTQHLLPKSKKGSENRQISLCVCPSAGVSHTYKHHIYPKEVWSPKVALCHTSKGDDDVKLCTIWTQQCFFSNIYNLQYV